MKVGAGADGNIGDLGLESGADKLVRQQLELDKPVWQPDIVIWMGDC